MQTKELWNSATNTETHYTLMNLRYFHILKNAKISLPPQSPH